FFNQTEDGIRYRNVTGVQTCALPISGRSRRDATRGFIRPLPLVCKKSDKSSSGISATSSRDWPSVNNAIMVLPNMDVSTVCLRRSEERRVGKECSYEWSREYKEMRTG